VFFDHRVNLRHQPDGFGESDDDFLVMRPILGGQGPTFAVFQPFLADLVAADVEVPHVLAHALERGLERLEQFGERPAIGFGFEEFAGGIADIAREGGEGFGELIAGADDVAELMAEGGVPLLSPGIGVVGLGGPPPGATRVGLCGFRNLRERE
jgi:hypothetical protein